MSRSAAPRAIRFGDVLLGSVFCMSVSLVGLGFVLEIASDSPEGLGGSIAMALLWAAAMLVYTVPLSAVVALVVVRQLRSRRPRSRVT
jgi:hypothetical protein